MFANKVMDFQGGDNLKMVPIIINGPAVRSKQFLHHLNEVLDLFWLKYKDIQERRGTMIESLPAFACGAVENNDLFSLQEIVSKMDLNSGTYDDIKVIHRASELGNIDFVKYLMKKGASLQPVNRFGDNTLSLAIKNRHYGLIKFLILKKAVLKIPPLTAIMHLQQAVANRDSSLVHAWFLGGVEMDGKDYNGRTAMHLAVRMRDRQLVKLLLGYGATPLERDLWNKTPLDEARRHNLDEIFALFHPRFTVEFPNKQAYMQHLEAQKQASAELD